MIRQVKKGEQGIAILAPMTYTTKETKIEEIEVDGKIVEQEVEKEVNKTYFRPVYVFDISQTEGEEMPEVDTSLENTRSELLKPLIECAAVKGIIGLNDVSKKVQDKNRIFKSDRYINLLRQVR